MAVRRTGRTPDAGYRQLRQDISAGKLGQLYIFQGEETYLREYYLSRVKEMILTGGMGAFNFHEIPARAMSPRALEEAVDSLPMMGERTLVLITDSDLSRMSEEDRKAYISIFENLPDYCCIVFYQDLVPLKLDMRTKLGAAVKKYGTVVNFERQGEDDLTDWIRRRFHAMGKDADAGLCREMIFRCGDLMTNLASEIEKVGAYAPGKTVTREDMLAVTTPVPDAVFYELTDAIGGRKFDQAISILGNLLRMQQNAFLLMASLSSHMRKLYSARLALEAGKGASYLADLWNIKSFPAKKLLDTARRLDLPWCRRTVLRCMDMDSQLKAAKTDRAKEDVLTGFLLEMAQSM